MSFCIQFGVRLRDMILILLISSHVDHFIRDNRIRLVSPVNLAVRSLDKTILVDSRIARQRVDQSDIRTFRRLNRAHAAIMGVMDVTNLKSGTIPRKAARTQSGQTSLMRQLRERIVLIHELRQL